MNKLDQEAKKFADIKSNIAIEKHFDSNTRDSDGFKAGAEEILISLDSYIHCNQDDFDRGHGFVLIQKFIEEWI